MSSLFKKIVAVMKDVGQLVKDGTVTGNNGQKMYNYLSEEQTTSELQNAFVKHGLAMFPIKVEDDLIYIETFKNGAAVKAPITKVKVTYKIVCSDTGESQELQSIGYGSDSQDKGSNKAMTGAFKYVQRQTFMISTGDDGDHVASECLDKQYASSTPPRQAQHPTQPVSPTTTQNSPTSQHVSVKMVSDAQIKLIGTLKSKMKVSDEVYKNMIAPKTSTKDLTMTEAQALISDLQSYVETKIDDPDDLPF